jgi:hypothetical protein
MIFWKLEKETDDPEINENNTALEKEKKILSMAFLGLKELSR